VITGRKLAANTVQEYGIMIQSINKAVDDGKSNKFLHCSGKGAGRRRTVGAVVAGLEVGQADGRGADGRHRQAIGVNGGG
jgi:hypothetical protein